MAEQGDVIRAPKYKDGSLELPADKVWDLAMVLLQRSEQPTLENALLQAREMFMELVKDNPRVRFDKDVYDFEERIVSGWRSDYPSKDRRQRKVKVEFGPNHEDNPFEGAWRLSVSGGEWADTHREIHHGTSNYPTPSEEDGIPVPSPSSEPGWRDPWEPS